LRRNTRVKKAAADWPIALTAEGSEARTGARRPAEMNEQSPNVVQDQEHP
jgi:hypothetical protein